MSIVSSCDLPISTPPSTVGDRYGEEDVQKMLAIQERVGSLITREPFVRDSIVCEEALARQIIERIPQRTRRHEAHLQRMEAIRQGHTPIQRALQSLGGRVSGLLEENRVLRERVNELESEGIATKMSRTFLSFFEQLSLPELDSEEVMLPIFAAALFSGE
ncbi:MAG: hypothetical protein H7A38_00485 [Chlamydiales bacterium]|nr:hypothetical protein [Chlamydiales bacterium]